MNAKILVFIVGAMSLHHALEQHVAKNYPNHDLIGVEESGKDVIRVSMFDKNQGRKTKLRFTVRGNHFELKRACKLLMYCKD